MSFIYDSETIARMDPMVVHESGVGTRRGRNQGCMAVSIMNGENGEDGVFVQADSSLETGIVLPSGSLTAGVLSSGLDVSSQIGYYNNAIMVGAGPSGSADVGIYASSDGVRYALVTTIEAMASGAYSYYELRGYETSIKLLPSVTQNYEVMLIRNR